MTYGNGLFVAVAGDGTNRVMTSPDGITWTARTAAENNSWYSVTYGNGQFVAVAGDGTKRVMTSPDGITWTARTASENNQWNGVTYGSGQFVAVASNGTNQVMTSSGGPSVSIAPSSQTITSGSSVTLTASGATSYTWSNGSTANPLVLSNVTSTTALSVTGTTGTCSATATATVSVTALSGPVLSIGSIVPPVLGPGNCPAIMNFTGSGLSFTLVGPQFNSSYPVRGGAVNRTLSFSGIKTTGQYTVCAVGNAAQTPVCQTFTVTGQSCP
ncbi:hypothetical protein GCM10027185_40020 [Spirosoma pulveris]